MTPTIIAGIPQNLEMRLCVQFVNQPTRGIIGIHQSAIAGFHHQYHAFRFGELNSWCNEGRHAVPDPMSNIPALRPVLAPQYLFFALGHDPNQG